MPTRLGFFFVESPTRASDIRFRFAVRMGWLLSGLCLEGPPVLSRTRLLSSSCLRAFLFFLCQSRMAASLTFFAGSWGRRLAACCLAEDSASYPSSVVWTLPVYFVPELSAGPYFLGRDILDRIFFLRSFNFLGRSYACVMGAGGAYMQRRRFCQRWPAFWSSPWLLSYAFEFWFHLGIS